MIRQPRIAFRVFLRRAPIALGIMAAFAAIGILVGANRTTTYTADALLMASFGQIDKSLSQTGIQTDDVLALQIIQRKILTRRRLEDIRGKLAGIAALDIQEIRDRTAIEVSGGSTGRGSAAPITVRVSFSHESPEVAKDVANEIARLVVTWNRTMRLEISERNLEVSADLLDRLSQKVTSKAEELRAFKTAHSGALPESLPVLRSEKELYERRLTQIDDRADTLRHNYIPQDANNSPDKSEPGNTLRTTQIEYDTLASVYAPSHPRMKALSAKISSLRRADKNEGDREGLDDESGKQIQKAISDGIASRREDVVSSLRKLEASLKQVPINALNQERLEEELAQLKADRSEASRDHDNAKSEYAFERQYMENRVELVETAVAPIGPDGYGLGHVVAFFAAAGLALGTVAVAAIEYFDKTLRHPQDVSSSIGIDPIGNIPFIPSDRDRLTTRLRSFVAPLVIPT